MPSDIPDYTKYVSVNVEIPDPERYQPTLAEIQEKSHLAEELAAAGVFCEITPPSGYKIVLLVIAGSAQSDGDNFKAQTFQGGTWKDIVPPIYLRANGHFVLCFPCWKPTQDVGDGSNKRFRLVAAGTGKWSGFVLYYLEAA